MNIQLPDSKAVGVFLLRAFAAVGVFLSVIILIGFLGLRHWLSAPQAERKMPSEIILSLDFTAPITERPQDFRLSLSSFLGEEQEAPLYAIVRAIDLAKDDPRVKGIVARFDSFEKPSLSQTQEIAAALGRFRASGKPTYSFAPSYGSFSPSGSLYALASQFENIWLQPVGSVGLTPLGIEAPFGKTALEKIGVQANFMRREDYKSAMENVSRDSFSQPVRQNMEDMIKSLQTQLVSLLAQGLQKKEGDIRALVAGGPYTATEAFKKGLVTKIGYEDEMEKEIKEKLGEKAEAIDPSSYLFYAAQNKKETKVDVALVYADGMIVDAPSKGPSRLAADGFIDTSEIEEAFEDISQNPKIKAVLFRVNSPGGSPTASETIRRALIRVKESGKPVFVSMGSVAASGGYWISMDADKIIADPATVTGSIGVVAGKFVLGGLYDKLGVKWDTLGEESAARLWSTRTPFGPKAQERMNAMLDETYDAFVSNVSAARKIPMKKMPDIAKGRVFTGEQALKMGLVDELGGMQEALTAIKKHLKLAETDEVSLRLYPETETPSSLVMKMLQKGGLSSALLPREFETLLPLWNEVQNEGAVRAAMPAFFLKAGW